MAGLKNENINKKLPEGVAPWYKGPTLLELLDKAPTPSRDEKGPLRIPILDSMKEGP